MRLDGASARSVERVTSHGDSEAVAAQCPPEDPVLFAKPDHLATLVHEGCQRRPQVDLIATTPRPALQVNAADGVIRREDRLEPKRPERICECLCCLDLVSV